MEIRVRGGFDNPLRAALSFASLCVHAACRSELQKWGLMLRLPNAKPGETSTPEKGKKEKKGKYFCLVLWDCLPPLCLGNHVTGSVRPKLKSMEKDLRSRQSIKNVSLLHLYTQSTHAQTNSYTHTHTTENRVDSALPLLPQCWVAGVAAAGNGVIVAAPVAYERQWNSRPWPFVAIICHYAFIYTYIHVYIYITVSIAVLSWSLFWSFLLHFFSCFCFSFAPFSHLNGGPSEQKYQRNKNVMNLFSVIVECSHDETQWKKKILFHFTSIDMIYFCPACCSSRKCKWLILWTKNKNPSKKVSKF